MAIRKIKIKNGTPIDINDARISGIDSTPTADSTNLVTSGGVKSALDALSSGPEYNESKRAIVFPLTSSAEYSHTKRSISFETINF